MNDIEFLRAKIRGCKKLLQALAEGQYGGLEDEELVDILLDSINDSRRRLRKLNADEYDDTDDNGANRS